MASPAQRPIPYTSLSLTTLPGSFTPVLMYNMTIPCTTEVLLALFCIGQITTGYLYSIDLGGRKKTE